MIFNSPIETDRLLLRLFTVDDADDMQRIVSIDEVVNNVNSTVETLEEVRESLIGLREKYKLNTPERITKLSLATVWKETHRVIGWVGLAPLEIDPADIELYYGLHPDYWGKGIATEAATEMLRYAFMTLKLPRITGLTLPQNHASSNVLQKIGLVYRWKIHDLPEEFCYFEDCNYFSLSRNDYIQLKLKPEEIQK